MKKIIQVHVSRGERYYVGECVDLPVVTQGETLDELEARVLQACASE
jgi:predicted RNase H-like HicB family nuclease